MIRLVQRKLIIPRGDTGSFTIPAIAAASTADVAIFTILDCRTHTKLFEKSAPPTGETFVFEFTHNDTVNLKPGKYAWDVKFYKNPVYADGQLVNGDEIDSYYAGFSLPECEIRETGDSLLISPDAPSGTLTPEQLDIISAALVEVQEAVEKTETNVEHYPHIEDDNHWYIWDANANEFVDTGVNAIGPGVAAGGTTGQLLKKASSADYDTEWADDIYATKADTVLETTLSLGRKTNTTVGTNSVALGYNVEASGNWSFAEGNNTRAIGANAHAEGDATIATGFGSHAEGSHTCAISAQAHAEGSGITSNVYQVTSTSNNKQYILHNPYSNGFTFITGSVILLTNGNTALITNCTPTDDTYATITLNQTIGNGYADEPCVIYHSFASGPQSHTEGKFTTAASAQQHAQGRFNVIDMDGIYADIVGNGSIANGRSNAYALDWQGNAYYAGDVYVGANSDSTGGIKLAKITDIPSVPVQDVQINNTSIIDVNGVANIQKASSNNLGVVGIEPQSGVAIASNGKLEINPASTADIKSGENTNKPIVPFKQDIATFYGLTKAAGVDMSSSANAVGTYTAEAKAAIQTMLDVPSTGALATKQDTLTFDSTPTAASTNPVTSDGIKDYVDTAVTNINTMRIHVCVNGEYDVSTGVPTIQNPDTQTFYLVPGGDSGNLYIEWVYVDNAWERFGSADIDLSGYALKTDTVLDTTLSRGRKAGTTIGDASFAFGQSVEASATYSFSIGSLTVASGIGAYASGRQSTASGMLSHAEGSATIASGNTSHAEGYYTTASGTTSHAEGQGTAAKGDLSHSAGNKTIAAGNSSYAGGRYNVEDSYASWPEWIASTSYEIGEKVKVTSGSTITGYICKIANSDSTFTDSNWTVDSYMNFAEIIGNGTEINARSNARALDWDGNEYLAGNLYVNANADSTGGDKVLVAADVPVESGSEVGSIQTKSIDYTGGPYYQIANGIASSAKGIGTTASGFAASAEGSLTVASNHSSHAEGGSTQATGSTSHAEGARTIASGGASHAEGEKTVASGIASHAEGYHTISSCFGSHVSGICNMEDNSTYPSWVANTSYEVGDKVIHNEIGYECKIANSDSNFSFNHWTSIFKTSDKAVIVGNGTADNARSNAYALGWDGTGHFAGNVYVNANADSSGGTKLATENIVLAQTTQPTAADNKIWIDTDATGSVQVPTVAEMNSALVDVIADEEASTTATAAHAINSYFMMDGKLYKATIAIAIGDTIVTTGAGANCEETTVGNNLHGNEIYIGSSAPTDPDVSVWIDTNGAVTDIVSDVQVNGSSVVSGGVANVPIASTSNSGVVKLGQPNNTGLQIYNNILYTVRATPSDCKTATNDVKPVVPLNQHASVFYGLTKAAGVDMASSSNAIGTYTEEAKTAIKSMLGVQDGLKVVRLI